MIQEISKEFLKGYEVKITKVDKEKEADDQLKMASQWSKNMQETVSTKIKVILKDIKDIKEKRSVQQVLLLSAPKKFAVRMKNLILHMDKCIEQLEKDARLLLTEYDEIMKTSAAKIQEYKDQQEKIITPQSAIDINDLSVKALCENPNEPGISKEDTPKTDEISDRIIQSTHQTLKVQKPMRVLFLPKLEKWLTEPFRKIATN